MTNSYSKNITHDTTVGEATQLRFNQDMEELLYMVLERIKRARPVSFDGGDFGTEAVRIADDLGVKLVPPAWIDELIERVEKL